MPHAELEIAVRRDNGGGHVVTLRYDRPDSAAEISSVSGAVCFDLDELRATSDPKLYGQALTRALFQDSAVLGYYSRVKSQLGGLTLRIRVRVERSAAELDTLRWELLRDPETDDALGLSERVILSRYLTGDDWRPVTLRARSQSRALIAVATGHNLADYGLAPIDLDGELTCARAGLGSVPVAILGDTHPVTLEALQRILREQRPDILYLIAHGRVHSGEPVIFLQNDAGAVKPTKGSALASHLKELAEPPALIVLASCESAGTGENIDAAPALAQLFNAAGVPAILAMQGRISMATVQRMMPTFFAELARDGQIDRALAVARGAVRDRHDAWAPVLFLRLKRGQLWLDEAPPAPLPFLDLADHLRAASRPPTWDDFEGGHFYHDAAMHRQIEGLLDERRRALLLGRSGSGKSALALSIGYRFLQADPAHRAFYTKHPQDTATPWLEAMLRHDRDDALFIVDNVHNSLEAGNELAELLGQVRRARVMLVSQPVDPALSGPEDENYFDLLDAVKVELNLDSTTLRGVLDVLVQRAGDLELGDETAVLTKCQGNLHLLRFYVNAWEKQPDRRLSEIEEAAVLQRVYAEYLREKPYAPALARLAALSQFEIAADRRLLGADGDSLAADPLCESLRSPQNDPQLQIYHATPARYLVLAQIHETEGLRRVDDWVTQTIEMYLRGNPRNFFAAFSQLYLAGRRDLQHRLFARLPLVELFAARLADSRSLTELDVPHLVRFIRGVWAWERRDPSGAAIVLLRLLDGWLRRADEAIRHAPEGERFLVLLLASWAHQLAPSLTRSWYTLASSTTLSAAALQRFLYSNLTGRREKDMLQTILRQVDWSDLGHRGRGAGLATLKNLMVCAQRGGADKASLRALTAELDWVDLGQRSRQSGPSTVAQFLWACTSAGVDAANLRVFAAQLDWTSLGQRARGFTTIRTIIERSFRAGVDRTMVLLFANALDWADLGRRARDVGARTVLNFLTYAHAIGVDPRLLRAFCAELNWASLGRFFHGEDGPRKSMLFPLHELVVGEHISREMAREFIEGLGWNNLRRYTNEVFGADVRIACRWLLCNKCGFQPAEVAARGLDFSHSAWQRSFLRPISTARTDRDNVWNPYLRHVPNTLGNGGLSEALTLVTELRELNILLRNAELVEPGSVARKLDLRLQRWPDWRWQRLLAAADLRNLSTFLAYFSPNGLFSWRPSARLKYELDGKLDTATVSELAHCLFNFRFVDRPELCRDLALALERSSTIAEKLAGAPLSELEFFFWNYWLALPPSDPAALCHLPGIVDVALSRLGDKLQHEADLLGLLGTWVMADGPALERLRAPVRVGEAKRLCLKRVRERSPALLRSLLGLSSLAPAPSAEEASVYRAALREIHAGPLVVEAIDSALARLDVWMASGTREV